MRHISTDMLFVKGKNCEFHVKTVSFLDYIIEQGNLKPDPVKVQVVFDWPKPSNWKQLQCFVGFTHFYHCFIRDIRRIALPLAHLISATVLFQWDQLAQTAFNHLKKPFVSTPILSLLDLTRQFIMEEDASDPGVGAVR